jgi:uncharacterized repeat protein (TIGR02543 family)
MISMRKKLFFIVYVGILGLVGGCAPPSSPSGDAAKPTSHQVSFDPSGGSGTLDAQSIAEGTTAALKTNTFTKANAAFAGWATSAANAAAGTVAYADQASYTMGKADATLYAVWVASHQVAFNANVTTSTNVTGTTAAQTVGQGLSTTLNANGFVYQGYTFVGWATSAADATAGTVAYADKAPYVGGTADTTLYAVWTPQVTVIKTLSLTSYPQPYSGRSPSALASNGTSVWVADKWAVAVYQLNASTSALESTTPLVEAASTLALDGDTLWTSNGINGGGLYQYTIGDSSKTKLQTVSLANVTNYATAMAYNPTAKVFWLYNSNGSTPYKMWKLDLTGAVLDSWRVGSTDLSKPYGMCLDFTDPGQYAWLSVGGNSLAKISLATHSIVAQYYYNTSAGATTLDKVREFGGMSQVDVDKFWVIDSYNLNVVEIQIH